jgi:ketosteroid isomerase-like protein
MHWTAPILVVLAACSHQAKVSEVARTSAPPMTATPTSDSASIRNIVDSLDNSIITALLHKDTEGVLKAYASDAIDVRDGRIVGVDTVRARLNSADRTITKFDHQTVRFYATGDLAVQVSTAAQVVELKGRPAAHVTGVFVAVYRRQLDGSWKTEIFAPSRNMVK